MRDKTASKSFRAKKKLDHFLEGLLPEVYRPLYAMVTFTRIPYAEAKRRAEVQDAIIYTGMIVLFVIVGFLIARLML
jgi:kynurenine 3-monooxygenase